MLYFVFRFFSFRFHFLDNVLSSVPWRKTVADGRFEASNFVIDMMSTITSSQCCSSNLSGSCGSFVSSNGSNFLNTYIA